MMMMSLLVLFLFSIAIFGFIFALALLVRKKPLAYYFFICVYLIFNFSLFVNLLIVLDYIQLMPHLYRVVSPLQFLLGPLCYFFFRTTLRPYQRFSKKDLLHFIPFLISFIGLLPIYFLPAEEKLRLIELGKDFKTAWHMEDTFGIDYVYALRIKFFIFFIYLFFQWKMILGYLKNASKELKLNNRSLQTWLFFDICLKTLIGILVFISAWLDGSAVIASLIQVSLISVEILGSAFFLIASPDLLKGVVFQEHLLESRHVQDIKKQEIMRPEPDEKEHTEQSPEHQDIMLRAEQFIQLEQPFLDPGFNLADLASALDVPARTLSQAIKSTLGIGFPEYVNKIRISFLEQQLTSKPEMLRFSIDALARSVGFSSRSGFYKAFRKVDQYESPAQMIEKIKEKKSSI